MLFAPAQLVTYISTLQNSLWPDGEMKPKAPPRTAAEKLATKESAGLKLAALMPGSSSLALPNFSVLC
jgi:sorting nexin-25